MFTDSIQITKLLSSWSRYCTLVWLHHIPDSLHFTLLSLQPPFPGVHPHLICTFQRAEQATYIFLFQSSNFLLDLTQRSISLSEISFGPHSNPFQNTAEWDSEFQFIYPLCIPSTVSKEMTHHNLINKNLFIHLATITKMITFHQKQKGRIFS